MTNILCIDPGNIESAYVVWNGCKILEKNKVKNEDLIRMLPDLHVYCKILVIEQIKSYGMPVGDTVFDTVFWTGRFVERWGFENWERVPRRDVKMYLCGSMRAKDGNIIQEIKNRYGEKGTKKNPGITYGCSKDIWQALALSIYYFDNILDNRQ